MTVEGVIAKTSTRPDSTQNVWKIMQVAVLFIDQTRGTNTPRFH